MSLEDYHRVIKVLREFVGQKEETLDIRNGNLIFKIKGPFDYFSVPNGLLELIDGEYGELILSPETAILFTDYCENPFPLFYPEGNHLWNKVEKFTTDFLHLDEFPIETHYIWDHFNNESEKMLIKVVNGTEQTIHDIVKNMNRYQFQIIGNTISTQDVLKVYREEWEERILKPMTLNRRSCQNETYQKLLHRVCNRENETREYLPVTDILKIISEYEALISQNLFTQ